MKRFLCYLFITLVFIPTATVGATDFYCQNKIVSTGDRKAEVYYKCGEPTWKDAWTKEVVLQVHQGHWVKKYVDIEEWIYNLGPSRFVRILTFVNNRLKHIQAAEYGFSGSEFTPSRECFDSVNPGDRKPEVIVKCGYPSFTSNFHKEHIKKTDKDRIIKFQVVVSEWVYDFGPHQFKRILIFENGKLVKAAKGDYGFEK